MLGNNGSEYNGKHSNKQMHSIWQRDESRNRPSVCFCYLPNCKRIFIMMMHIKPKIVCFDISFSKCELISLEISIDDGF